MRVLSVVGVVLVWAARSMAAQEGRRFEFGSFGSYTRFDDAFNLPNRVGGGARLGYFLSDGLSLELEGIYLGPSSTTGNPSYGIHLGSASLALNLTGERSSLYGLAGFSRLDVGTTAPYNLADNGAHGAIGIRYLLTGRLALRAEGRALYVPESKLTATAASHLIGSIGLSYLGGDRRRPPVERPEMPRPLEPEAAEPAPPEPARPARDLPRRREPQRPSGRPQHNDQLEVGVYGTFTRFDHLYNLPNRVGGGVRFGYFLSNRVSLEADGMWLGPSTATGDASYLLHVGSGSLVLNFPVGSHMVYLLGGFTRIDNGTDPPYNFAENGAHGGGGLRILLANRLALRLDGRAFYWTESPLTGEWVGHAIGSAGVSYFMGVPKRPGYVPRAGERNYQWYWGGQGGLFFYKTNVQGLGGEPVFGGHWLITAKRTALLLGYEQSFFLSDGHAVVFDPQSTASSVGPGFRDVTFTDLRRILFGLVAHPAQRTIEPFFGGGFALMQVLDPLVDCSACANQSEAFNAQEIAEDAASKAFFWILGGLQINYSRRLNVFGQYMLTSASRDFLLQGNTHTLQGGVRISLGSAKEGLTEPR